MSNPTNQHPPNQPDPLAVALAKIDPAPHGFDWNALMFAAGRESKARALLFWRVATGACAFVALVLAVVLLARPTPAPVERPVYFERTAPKAQVPAPQHEPVPGQGVGEPEPPAPWNYDPVPEPGAAVRWLNLRNEVLTAGLDALPSPGPKVTAPASEK